MAEPTTFTEAVQLQTTIMLNIARRLDEKGYAVVIKDRVDPSIWDGVSRFMFGFAKKTWGEAALHRRIKPVIVTVISRDPCNPFETLTGFYCHIPNRKHYKAIHSAVRLMSTERKYIKNSWQVIGNGIMQCQFDSNYMQITGNSTDALEVLLRVLDMPHHRAILTGGGNHA